MSDVQTQTQSTQEGQTSSSPEPTASTASAPTTGTVDTQGSQQTMDTGEYSPDYKFKYRDDKTDEQLEAEIDEWARGYLNKDNESKFKELYAKAYGLDFTKKKLNHIRDEYKKYREELDPLVGSWKTLTDLYNKGDLHSFFQGLQIPDEKIFNYVMEKLKYHELPPEQKAEYDRNIAYRQQAYELEQRNQMLQKQYQAQAVQTREVELNTALTSPEVQQIASEFDKRTGKPGAFRSEVIRRGMSAYYETGRDIPASQAIAETMQLFGSFLNQNQQAGTQPQAQMPQQPPTLPNLSGKKSAPVKRSPKSLDDIRKIAKQMNE